MAGGHHHPILWVTGFVVANTSQLLGFLILLLIPAVVFYWRHNIKRAMERKLKLGVDRDPAAGKAAAWPKAHPLLAYLELDDEVAAADFPALSLLSMGEYMASLKPRGMFSMEAALVSILDHSGLRIALPLALFSPPSWRKERSVTSAFSGSPYAALLVSNSLSTLGLISVSTIAQRQTIDARKYGAAKVLPLAPRSSPETALPESVNGSPPLAGASAKKKDKLPPLSALELMVLGANPRSDGGLSSRVPNLFTLPDDLAAASEVETLDAAGSGVPMDAPPPAAVNAIFPGLFNGNGGLKLICSESQVAVNRVIAVVFNRLAANSLVGFSELPAAPKERFIVRLPTMNQTNPAGGGASPSAAILEVESVEGFVAALEGCGHSVTVQIASNMTSFGAGMSVKEPPPELPDNTKHAEVNGGKEIWTQIPLVYPLCTGLYAQDAAGNDIDVMTLMQHAGVSVDVSGPLITASVEWCLNIGGMTGWGPNAAVDRPWANGSRAKVYHAAEALASPAGRRAALRLTTASAAVLNVAASESGMLFGGYGSLGVCIDSVAAIQQVLTGTCTLYPLILGGDAKMRLFAWYRHVERMGKKAEKKGLKQGSNISNAWVYAAEAEALQAAIAALPCDGIVDPTVAAATARRALGCLPERSVFAGVKKCKESLEAALEVAERVMGARRGVLPMLINE